MQPGIITAEEQLRQVTEATNYITLALGISSDVEKPLAEFTLIILGTGLHGTAKNIEQPVEILYENIPNCPKSTAPGHQNGKLIFGRLNGKLVVAMCGRFHFYEGHSMFEVTFMLRNLLYLGVSLVISTSSVGGINSLTCNHQVGGIAVVENHNSLVGGSPDPLIGPLFPNTQRFVDTSKAYDPALIGLAIEIANEEGIDVKTAILGNITGPCFENTYETEILRTMKCTVVGMSGIPEAKVTKSFPNTRFLYLVVITDILDDGTNINPISAHEVIKVAEETAPRLGCIIEKIVVRTKL